MPNSNLLVLRDLTTGAGRTGLTVKLRNVTDNFATDVFTAAAVAGKPGVYEFIDVPVNKYKLWVNGAEDTSFGGTNGKWWPTDDLLAYLAEKLYLDAAHINSGTFAVGRIPNLGASIITSGVFDYARLPFFVGQYSNMLLVDSSLPDDVAGRAYKTVQGAINYAQTQIPSLNNQWVIYIMPGKTKKYAENITLQPWVHLQGLFGYGIIEGNLSGININSRLNNIFLKYTGNLTLQNLYANFSIFQLIDGETGFTLTVTNCKLNTVGLVSGGGGANPQIVSGGGNVFTGGCWSNTNLNLADGDKGIVDSLQDKDYLFVF